MTHTGVKHIKCLLCEKAYSVRKSLRRHLLEKHEVSPEHPQYKHCFYAMSAAEAGLHIPEGVPTNISGDPTEGKSWLCLVIENKMSSAVNVKMLLTENRSWCTSVIIVSDYRLDDQSLITGRGKGFFLYPQCPDSSEAHPFSCPLCTAGPFPGV
jgi:hypothetical protein